MNVIALLDFQTELLKPFAPSQEFALLTLIVPSAPESMIFEFCDCVSRNYPFVTPLYDEYANKRPEKAIPLIVPVAHTETAREEIFAHENGRVEIEEKFAAMLSTFVARVSEHISSPDELNFGYQDRAPRITLEEIRVAMIHGFYTGIPLIVRARRKNGTSILTVWRSLFPAAA